MSFLFKRRVRHQPLDPELHGEFAVPAPESWLHDFSAPVELDSRESVGERPVNINQSRSEFPRMPSELASWQLVDEHVVPELDPTHGNRTYPIHQLAHLQTSNSTFYIDIWPRVGLSSLFISHLY
jgi:hypothetical protein